MKDCQSFLNLYKVIKELRGPNGCPWDKEQTIETLIPDLIEESYELADAIFRKKDKDSIVEEMGDILLVWLMLGSILEEKGIDLEKIINLAKNKIVARHPHVFGEEKVKNSQEVLSQWEKLKEKEKKKGYHKEYLEDINPLKASYKIQKRAARFGFDWENAKQVFNKLQEEMKELEEVVNNKDATNFEKIDEVGDILFVTVNLARHLGIDPVIAMIHANKKFNNRFSHVEEKLRNYKGKATLEIMDKWWQEAKKKEKKEV